MKGQPLAYNKDNQEDKEPLFDCIDTLKGTLTALNGLIPNIEPIKDAMAAAASNGFTTATDLADYLVKRGLPFRDAHHAVGAAVSYAIQADKHLHELSLKELADLCNTNVGEDVFDVLTTQGSAAARSHLGGTAPATVAEAVTRARLRIEGID